MLHVFKITYVRFLSVLFSLDSPNISKSHLKISNLDFSVNEDHQAGIYKFSDIILLTNDARKQLLANLKLNDLALYSKCHESNIFNISEI